MKRLSLLLVVLAMSVGYLAGIATTWTASAAVQPPAPARAAGWGRVPLAPDQGQPVYWSIDDLKNVHAQLAARSNGRILSKPFDLAELPFTRTHYFDIVHRPPLTAAPTAEQHEGVTDVYVVIGGSGTVMLGGEIENRRVVPNRPGEFQGLLRGGRSYRVKAGDVLNVPPNTPHASLGDPGGLTYMLLKINVGLYPWSIVAGVP